MKEIELRKLWEQEEQIAHIVGWNFYNRASRW